MPGARTAKLLTTATWADISMSDRADRRVVGTRRRRRGCRSQSSGIGSGRLPGLLRGHELPRPLCETVELERTEGSADELRFDVTQCGYADFFNALGLPELGYMFCCSRDSAMAEAFGGDITLERAHTIMEGANSCDFRFVRRG